MELRAADGTRPTLLLDGEISITGDASSTFALNGLLLAAAAGHDARQSNAGRAGPRSASCAPTAAATNSKR